MTDAMITGVEGIRLGASVNLILKPNLGWKPRWVRVLGELKK
jgi:hypothetical protein